MVADLCHDPERTFGRARSLSRVAVANLCDLAGLVLEVTAVVDDTKEPDTRDLLPLEHGAEGGHVDFCAAGARDEGGCVRRRGVAAVGHCCLDARKGREGEG